MRAHVFVFLLAGVVSMAPPVRSQVYSLPTPAPQVTAAGAGWQIAREPVFHAGDSYHATGPTEFFDGRVMVRTGTYRGIPLYENSTIEPFSVVYVPIGGNLVRPYERLRDRELAGTVGSRAPSFPITREGEIPSMEWTGPFADLPSLGRPGRAQWDWPAPIDVSAVVSVESLGELSSRARVPAAPPVTAVPGARRETTNSGAYVHFDGTRFYTTGRAVSHSADRFARVGEIAGAPVYREIGGPTGTIFVEAVPGGLLAPYAQR
jgi:hypothetical protein